MSDVLVENVSHRYPDQLQEALTDVSLNIRTGVINGLLGPNGAGKTTLIHIICGLIKPTRGKVETYDGNQLSSVQKKNVGFVPQQDGLFPDLTLKENLNYYGGLYQINKNLLSERIRFYAAYLQLDTHFDKQIRHYSGGMNRRANIIAALLHDPSFIIFDEPTAGVDIQSRALIHEVIHNLQASGKTILYTSHLLSEAETLCDQIFIMDDGKLLLSGSPEQLILDNKSENLEQLFLSLTGHKVRD